MENKNQDLSTISKQLYGDEALLEIINPRELKQLKSNARYFKKNTYRQLVDNLKKDGRLSSMPLCYRHEDGSREVLSGNHRVQGAIDAGLDHILVLTLIKPLEESGRIAIQLSHNALEGEDDPQILADLWSRISDIKEKLYAGLSSDTQKELENIKLTTFATPQVATKIVTFAFTTSEKELLDQVLDELSSTQAPEIYLTSLELFEEFFQLLEEAKKKKSIKNSSLALVVLIDLAREKLQEA